MPDKSSGGQTVWDIRTNLNFVGQAEEELRRLEREWDFQKYKKIMDSLFFLAKENPAGSPVRSASLDVWKYGVTNPRFPEDARLGVSRSLLQAWTWDAALKNDIVLVA
ncbi:MAG: hypothetical protein H6862_05535 [Rhodospirillales bacterium]|nr:hypothetical protein [Rhodospirillales bacterium]